MNAYRVELFVIDFDGLGEEEIVEVLENTRYPNDCITPEVKAIDARDIGKWTDDHPLNKHATADDEYRRLFAEAPRSPEGPEERAR